MFPTQIRTREPNDVPDLSHIPQQLKTRSNNPLSGGIGVERELEVKAGMGGEVKEPKASKRSIMIFAHVIWQQHVVCLS